MCVSVCAHAQPTWHLLMKTVSLSTSGLTAVLLTHTQRDNHTEQRGRGRREEESRKGRVRERNRRVGGVREEERSTHKYYTVVRMYTHQASIALYGTDMRHTPLPDV